MAQSVGIDIILKENIADRLGKVLPMLEKMEKTFQTLNKTLTNLETSQKRVDNNFKNIGHSVDMVSQKERGLRNLNSGITNIGNSAGKAGSMLGGLLRTLGLLGVAYKGIQGAEFLGGSALDFQKEAVSLQQSNLSKDLQKRVIEQSLSLGSSGKYAMSGTDFLKSFKETRSVSPTPEAALSNLPFIGQLDMQFRKISEKLAGQADILPRFFEKFGAFSDKDKRTVADALLKTEQYTGGTISPAQILQQISTSGTSVVGADPYKMLTEQAYSIKESAAGAGHGSGGRGRGGVGQQAVDRMMNLGVITPAQATMMAQAGMLEGITSGSGKTGHSLLIEDGTGKHILRSGGSSGSSKLKTSDVSAFLLNKRPEWMKLHANDPYETGLDFAAGADALGGNKIPGSFMQTRDAHIKHFGTLPTAEQKFLEGRLMAGMKMTGVDFLMERSVGRYKQSHDYFAAGVAGQPGLSAAGETSVKDRWDKLIKGLETFGDALGNNENIIKSANSLLDGLTRIVKSLNDNVEPIAKWLTGGADPEKKLGVLLHGNGSPERMASGFTNAANFAWQGGKGGPNVGRILWKNLKGGTSSVINNIVATAQAMGKDPVTALATAMHESGLNPFAVGDHGTSFGLYQLHRGGELGSMSPNQAFDPITNIHTALSHFTNGTGGAMAARAQRPLNPTAYAQAVDALMPQAREMIIHNDIHLDGKKIGEHVSRHVAKQQAKNTLKYSNSGSQAGGSYTDKVHNAGGGQE